MIRISNKDSSKLVISFIFIILFFCFKNIILAASSTNTYELRKCFELGGFKDNKRLYETDRTSSVLKIYKMESNSGKDIFCLSPGLAARSEQNNNTYTTIKSSNSGLTSCAVFLGNFGSNDNFKYVCTYQNGYQTVKKDLIIPKSILAYHMFSEIYLYNCPGDENIVYASKQILIWRVMKLLNSLNGDDGNYFYKKLQLGDLKDDLKQAMGTNVDTNIIDTIAQNTVLKVDKFYIAYGVAIINGIEVNKIIDEYEDIRNKKYDDPDNNGKKISSNLLKNMTICIPVEQNENGEIKLDAKGNPVRKELYQIITTEEEPDDPPNVELEVNKYQVLHKYYDINGNYECTENKGTQNNYSGTQTINGNSSVTRNNHQYQKIGSKMTNSFADPGNVIVKSGSENNYSFNSGIHTIVFYYQRQYDPSKITFKHIYTNSQNETDDSNVLVVDNIRSKEYTSDFISNWKDYFVDFGQIQGVIIAKGNDGKIHVSWDTEGTEFVVYVNYKSKKVISKYVKVTEIGKTESKENQNSGEINVNSSYKFTVESKYSNHKYMGTTYPDKTETNWETTTFTNDSKNCGEYVYTSYYENRDLWKYIKLSNNNEISDFVYEKRENDFETTVHDNTLEFNKSYKISNNFLNSFYTNDNKYTFDSKFSLGTSRTKNENGSWNNRFDKATKSANSNKLSYFKNNASNRTVAALTNMHSQTIVANFYYELEKPVSVYVRHILKNKDGSYTVSTENDISFLKNDTEIYKDSTDTSNKNGWKVIYNGYNQRKYHSNKYNYNDNIPNGFSEYFVIDKSDNLKLEKSKTVLYDGEEYKVIGYKKYSGAVRIEQSTGCTTYSSPVSISEYGAGKKVYVDFYYEKTDYSNDDPPPTPEPPEDPNDKYKNLRGKAAPSLLFNPENGSGEGLESIDNKVAYVPATEYIRPYFETASFVPYDLIYKINDVDGSGNPTYKLTTYNAYQLISSDVVNKSDLNNEALMLGTESKSVITTSEGSIAVGFNGISTPNKNDYLSDSKKMISSIKIGEKTSINNYKDVQNSKKVESNKYNGLRKGDGTVTYKLTKIVGEKPTYNKTATINVVNAMDVNVFTPMQVANSDIKSTGSFVNHSDINGNSVIQKDTEFTVTPKIKEDFTLGYNHLSDRYNYLKGYYIIFAFDVEINGQNNPAYCPVWVDKGGSITAIPRTYEGESSVKQLQEKIYTIAVTINTPDIVKNVLEKNRNSFNEGIANEIKSILNNSSELSIIDLAKNGRQTDESKNPYQPYLQNYKAVSKYFVKNITATFVLARLYDFKITDCYDVNYKNVFRQFDSVNGTVNGLTNICFYSGKNKLSINEGNNVIYSRKENTILPLGPYKHTQKDYTKAPKLGYRISFDVKTYGYYNYSDSNEAPKRRIQITPKYYYISKDGQTYKENIKLYYKNSSGKYTTFNDSNYNIAFTPNDGYRSQYNNGETPDSTNLSTKKVNLSIGKVFTLEPKTMMTTSNDKFVQAWYGEYKVPNSTIIVEENNGKVDLNNPLTDGYLGVIFKIECIDEGEGKKITILYDQDDKAAQGGNHNTSEWDYEGYLGCVSGKNFSGTLQLEKGKWEINDDLYQKIKGTVVLYDIDDRAANDFD